MFDSSPLKFVLEALEASGYSETGIRLVSFKGSNAHNDLVFECFYKNDEGETDSGNVYVKFADGKWLGEF